MKNKRILKLAGSICIVVVLAVMLLPIGCAPEDGGGGGNEEGPLKIGIFQIISHPALLWIVRVKASKMPSRLPWQLRTSPKPTSCLPKAMLQVVWMRVIRSLTTLFPKAWI